MEPTILLVAAAALGGLAVGALLGACLTMARFGFDPFDGTVDDESPTPRESSRAQPLDVNLAEPPLAAPAPGVWIGPPECIRVTGAHAPWGGGCSSCIRGQCQAIQRTAMRSGQWIPVDRQP